MKIIFISVKVFIPNTAKIANPRKISQKPSYLCTKKLYAEQTIFLKQRQLRSSFRF